MGWSTTKEVFDFTIDGPGESIFARHRWLAKMILWQVATLARARCGSRDSRCHSSLVLVLIHTSYFEVPIKTISNDQHGKNGENNREPSETDARHGWRQDASCPLSTHCRWYCACHAQLSTHATTQTGHTKNGGLSFGGT